MPRAAPTDKPAPMAVRFRPRPTWRSCLSCFRRFRRCRWLMSFSLSSTEPTLADPSGAGQPLAGRLAPMNFIEDVMERAPASTLGIVALDAWGNQREWHFGELIARSAGLSGAMAARG